ncbi:hypothetical protein [Metabacillus arenae]|uniref:Uncharacterized protein n=1 Tax=Metabacillus arenae TaxID=2771434 RepID=A0A926NN52_9BACI|nr:hypothetical protein [Metabacillus arenae]MBD1380871.1 hypothetical protein [Metabacillus arenae]
MGKQPELYVLDDKLVAVFSVNFGECVVKMECLFSDEEIVDYTIVFNGTVKDKERVTEKMLIQAVELCKNQKVYV